MDDLLKDLVLLGGSPIDSMKQELFQISSIRQTKTESHRINSLKHSSASNRISHNGTVNSSSTRRKAKQSFTQ